MNNTQAAFQFEAPKDVQILRISRLLKGTRGDLRRHEEAQRAGWTTDVHGKPIEAALETYRETIRRFETRLVELGAS